MEQPPMRRPEDEAKETWKDGRLLAASAGLDSMLAPSVLGGFSEISFASKICWVSRQKTFPKQISGSCFLASGRG